jgi:hypothetical protein
MLRSGDVQEPLGEVCLVPAKGVLFTMVAMIMTYCAPYATASYTMLGASGCRKFGVNFIRWSIDLNRGRS